VPKATTATEREQRIAVTRKGKEPSLNTDKTLIPNEISQGLNQVMDEVFLRLQILQSNGTVKSLQETMG